MGGPRKGQVMFSGIKAYEERGSSDSWWNSRHLSEGMSERNFQRGYGAFLYLSWGNLEILWSIFRKSYSHYPNFENLKKFVWIKVVNYWMDLMISC